MIKSPNSSTSNVDNWREPVVRLRGLPYNATKDDVTRFFNGLKIAQNGIHISSSKSVGEAFVAFMNMDTAQRALNSNRMQMANRYIEVFKATYAEARQAIMNDSQVASRQRAQTQRQNNYSGANGYENYHQYNGPQGTNYPVGTGIKRPMSISFTMKIRGVPFEAGEKDVFEFFNPVVPIRLEQENTPRGKPPIWYAEFGSREEASEALTYHKRYMGTRYIELLPLYDDGNRSKMSRN